MAEKLKESDAIPKLRRPFRPEAKRSSLVASLDINSRADSAASRTVVFEKAARIAPIQVPGNLTPEERSQYIHRRKLESMIDPTGLGRRAAKKLQHVHHNDDSDSPAPDTVSRPDTEAYNREELTNFIGRRLREIMQSAAELVRQNPSLSKEQRHQRYEEIQKDAQRTASEILDEFLRAGTASMPSIQEIDTRVVATGRFDINAIFKGADAQEQVAKDDDGWQDIDMNNMDWGQSGWGDSKQEPEPARPVNEVQASTASNINWDEF